MALQLKRQFEINTIATFTKLQFKDTIHHYAIFPKIILIQQINEYGDLVNLINYFHVTMSLFN